MTTPMAPDPGTGWDTPASANQPAPRSANALGLVLVTLALLAGAAGTFMFLSAHPVAREAASDGTPAAAAASSGAPSAHAPTPAAVTNHWSRENEYRWVANRKRSVAYELDANQQVRVWTTHVRPTLVVRCLNRKTEVFVFTETPSKMESTDGLHTVRLTFDDGAEANERWPDSAEHDALFAPDGTSLARQISSAHHLKFGFSPHNADPAMVDFDLGDAGPVIANVAKTCGWKMEDSK
jgi:hypothetical protein